LTAQDGHAAVATPLINNGADVKAFNDKVFNEGGFTPLHLAESHQHTEVVKAVIACFGPSSLVSQASAILEQKKVLNEINHVLVMKERSMTSFQRN